MVTFLQTLFFLFMILLCLFLIVVVLIQRGKGGGLVGAFGGMGGNSAFGAKSSDVFLRITVVAVIIWFVACLGGRYILNARADKAMFGEVKRSTPVQVPNETAAPAVESTTPPAADAPAADTKAPSSDVQAPAADTKAASGDVKAPVADAKAASGDVKAPVADTKAASAPAESPQK